MTLRRKRRSPIDRAVEQLDQQIATVQKELRTLQHGSAQGGANSTARGEQVSAASTTAETVTGFVKQMLAPPKKAVAPSYRVRRDLFDVDTQPLKDLEAEPIELTRKTESSLFTQTAVGTSPGIAADSSVEDTETAQEKLARYLSAGSLRTHRPLKRAQRQARNRFFMWLGLSFVTLWVIYFVAR